MGLFPHATSCAGNLERSGPEAKQRQAPLEAGGLRAFPTASLPAAQGLRLCPEAALPPPAAARLATPTSLSRACVSTCQDGELCQGVVWGGRQSAPSPARPGLRSRAIRPPCPEELLGTPSLPGRRERGLLGLVILQPLHLPTHSTRGTPPPPCGHRCSGGLPSGTGPHLCSSDSVHDLRCSPRLSGSPRSSQDVGPHFTAGDTEA